MESILEAEHPALFQSAVDLTGQLAVARERLVPLGDTWHHQHTEFGERTWSLYLYLQGALILLDHDQYIPALASVRCALEHHVLDHLIFLGSRYRAVVHGVTEGTLNEWQLAIEEGREDFRGILQVRRLDTERAEVVRSGPHFTGSGEGPGAPSLSIYYGIVFDRYDPFTGGKKAQDYIGRWPHEATARRRFATQAAETWGRFLSWRQLMANLLLNEFYTEREVARFEVHYGFLSAFTHPTARGLKAVFGRTVPTAVRYDHYVSELILLYVVVLAALELQIFEEMAAREPRVGLGEWERVHADVERGLGASAHLWFPRGSPHSFDRVQEANKRGVTPEGGLLPWTERVQPDELREEEVGYYANPLRRLIEMHGSWNEITGFPYVSPWPRTDSQLRTLD